VQEDQRDAVLIAVQNEACGFFGRFGINHPAKLYALLIGVRRMRLDMFFLIREDADRPAANSGVTTQ
jgi:hypothetical protein